MVLPHETEEFFQRVCAVGLCAELWDINKTGAVGHVCDVFQPGFVAAVFPAVVEENDVNVVRFVRAYLFNVLLLFVVKVVAIGKIERQSPAFGCLRGG